MPGIIYKVSMRYFILGLFNIYFPVYISTTPTATDFWFFIWSITAMRESITQLGIRYAGGTGITGNVCTQVTHLPICKYSRYKLDCKDIESPGITGNVCTQVTYLPICKYSRYKLDCKDIESAGITGKVCTQVTHLPICKYSRYKLDCKDIESTGIIGNVCVQVKKPLHLLIEQM